MQPTLLELVEHGLLTQDEAREIQGYVTSNPADFLQVPPALQDKALLGLVLLEAEPPPGPMH